MAEAQFPPTLDVPLNSSPRPISEIPHLWLQLPRMTQEFFAAEAPRASASNTFLSIVAYAVVSAILLPITNWIGTALQKAIFPSQFRETIPGSVAGSFAFWICFGLIGTPLLFYLSSGLIYVAARILGGVGDFNTQTYLQSLYVVPAGLLSNLISWIPCLGPLVTFAVGIYLIVLNVRVFMVVHRLTMNRAIAAVLVPGLLIGLLVACLIGIAVFGLVAYQSGR